MWSYSQWQEGINEVIEARQKYAEDAKPYEDSSNNWRYPVYRLHEARPCKPVTDVTNLHSYMR